MLDILVLTVLFLQLSSVFKFFHHKNLEKNSSPLFHMVVTLNQRFNSDESDFCGQSCNGIYATSQRLPLSTLKAA